MITSIQTTKFINPKRKEITMKKFLSLTVAAALAMGFAACSSDEPIVNSTSPTADDGEGSYIQFIVSATGTSSRADEENLNLSSNETSGSYRTGTSNENQVLKVYAYFSKDGVNLIKLDGTDEYYAEYGAVKVNNSTVANSPQYSSEKVTEAADKGEAYVTAKEKIDAQLTIGDTYKVYLLCNKPAPKKEDGSDITTVKELLDSKLEFDVSQSDNIATDGIPMAARSIKGVIYDELTPTKDNTISNPATLSYEVERAFGRIAITSSVTDIPLYEIAKDPTKNADGEYDFSLTNKVGSLDILKYYIVNQSKTYYTYRHVGNLTGDLSSDLTPVMPEDAATLFGPVDDAGGTNPYVIDPYSHKKTGAYIEGYTQSFNFAYRHYSKFKKAVGGTSDEPAVLGYMPENVMVQKAQKKGQATGVIFQVRIKPTTVIGADGNAVANFNPATADEVWYYDGVFYDGIEAIQKNVSSQITKGNYLTFDIQCYKKCLAYYEYFIRHNNNYKYTEMDNMEFAIVRNNSYELAITAAAMAPYTTLVPSIPNEDKDDPMYDPDNDPDGDDESGDDEEDPDDPEWPPTPNITDEPDPNTPKPGEDVENANLYLRVKIVVRPWIMRVNPTVLGLGS
jgi:hypothetical protein